jgi:predicted SAM-dependent methyltransferase
MKINMGCGKRNFGKDWVHIDGGDYEHLEYSSITDLSQYENSSINLIYASHIIEYFDRDEVKEILKEWYRVLKPEGILRIAVPNFKIIASLYKQNKYELESFLGPLYGKMTMKNETIYHKTVYDFKSLSNILKGQIGFQEVRHYKWQETEHAKYDDHSQAYLPHMNKENGTLISLNVEAVK